jgi:hypothetical protein
MHAPPPAIPEITPTRIRWRAPGHLLRSAALFILLGALATIAVAWLCAMRIDVLQGTSTSADGYIDESRWTVTTWSTPGALYIHSLRELSPDWSPGQAAGQPDTPVAGDQVTAWASATPDASSEWLVLTYPTPVIPQRLQVYESFHPGALTRVSVFDESGREVVAWSGVDPTPPTATSGTSNIPLSLNFKTQRVKLYIDSANIPGWNEIDAVALIGDAQTQWATSVEASSWYASGRAAASSSATTPQSLIPFWSNLRYPSRDLASGLIRREQRSVDARGWPMVALWSERPPASASPITTITSGSRLLNTPYAPYSGLVYYGAATTSTPLPAMLPFRPVWSGFLLDTLLFAAALWLAFWCLAAPRRFILEVSRMRRGHCIRCGYELGYDFTRGCPECGWRRTGNEPGASR